ncbi:ABC transporter permease [Herbidospora mongoliensis]|uniref:ABC transporter permease n=1 Tax=Herbidospora mongoliensis TaxID=688067 RepID=UPI0008336779|nr:ABC transporter permease [Herbidospora mongoliensis]
MTAYTIAHFRLTQRLFWRTPVSIWVALGFPVLFAWLLPLAVPEPDRLIVGIVVTGAGLLGFATLLESFVVKRQLLILKRLRGTELPDLAIFGGEILTVVSIGLVQLVAIVGVANAVHGVALPADPLLLAVTVLLALAVFAAMGVAVSGRVPSTGSIIAVSLPFHLLNMGLSGLVLPLSDFPEWAGIVAAFLPFGWAAEGITMAYFGGFVLMWPGWLVLVAWLVLSLLAARRWFKWEPQRG